MTSTKWLEQQVKDLYEEALYYGMIEEGTSQMDYIKTITNKKVRKFNENIIRNETKHIDAYNATQIRLLKKLNKRRAKKSKTQ